MNTLEQYEAIDSGPESIRLDAYPVFKQSIPDREICADPYRVRFARTREDLDQVLKLRFEVFNLELGEGLESSFHLGRDLDQFDPNCHHLIVEEIESSRIVGTYRMQTGEMASSARGFYTATEFDLGRFPTHFLPDSVELGRACVARDYRNTQVLFLLWKGLAAYVAHNRKRYLFGCCSLTSQKPSEGFHVMELLERGGNIHPDLHATPHSGFECYAGDESFAQDGEVSIPKLFRIYLRCGAKVCGPPAIDRLFKTIDFLVLFDVFGMDPQMRRMFFEA
jgi:putative hemolysin